MIYLIDTSVLIDAKDFSHKFDHDPQYWETLMLFASEGHAKLPREIFDEVIAGNDELSAWAKQERNQLSLNESVNENILNRVLLEGYGLQGAFDLGLEAIDPDAMLIAYALADPRERVVVTNENRTNKMPHNRSIPDVCDIFGISVCNMTEFDRILKSFEE